MSTLQAWLLAVALGPPGDPSEPMRVEEPPAEPTSPAQLELHWNAPQGCPTAAEIEAAYRAQLHGAPAGSGTMVVDATITEAGQRWTMVLQTDFAGAVDVRTLHAARCDELGSATATLLAIALEPALAQPEAEPPPHEVPEPEPEPEPEPTIEPDLDPDPVADRRPQPAAASEPVRAPPIVHRRPAALGLVRGTAGFEWGMLPGPSARLALAVGALWPRLRLEADAAWVSPSDARGPMNTRLLAQMVVASAHACARPRIEPIELPICGGIEGGIVRAVPRGLPDGTPVTGPWLGPSARVGVAYAWSRVGVYTAAGVVGRAWGTRLRIGGTRVFEPEVVSIRLVAGIEGFFGRDQP